MTTNEIYYQNEKKKFFAKHGHEFHCYTSELDAYDSYHKEYAFADGAIWYEVMRPEWHEAVIESVGLRFAAKEKVKLFSTEFWSTDNAESSKCYSLY